MTMLSVTPDRPPPLELIEDLAHRVTTALVSARRHHDAVACPSVLATILAVVAHDLRNPLSAVLIRCAMMLRESPEELDEPRRQHVQAIKTAGVRMQGLTNDLLDAAAIDVGQLRLLTGPCRWPRSSPTRSSCSSQSP